jgi:RimJ/RimL family protein N-acetyltransferase
MHCLYTKRLSLRPCQFSDLDAVHRLWTEADVRRFLFDDRQISPQEAQSFIQASNASFMEHGYGLWLFFEHQSDQIGGFSGLLHSSQEPPSLIFGTQPQLWGRGYAREAALSVLQYARDQLGLKQVVADVDQPNVASSRVLEALGMSPVGSAIAHGHCLIYYNLNLQ